jgi:Kef-type K+ transport system membrane component KefB
LLALSSSFAKQGNALAGVWTLLLAIAFVLFMILPVRRMLVVLHEYFIKIDDESGKTMMVIVILVLLAASFVAEEIGIHSFFGAFVAGLVVPKSGKFVEDLAPKIELITVEFFLPLYFANSGIKTQIGTLSKASDWGVVLVITLVATFAKFTPAAVMTKVITKRGTSPESKAIGVEF